MGGRLALLEHLMYEPLFDTLRTKQQLGYTVQCSARNTQVSSVESRGPASRPVMSFAPHTPDQFAMSVPDELALWP